ncbi:MAG TPA: M20/M25/M40 family metallo-hydrolase [Gaiellaceae bacterium]|nr:M20/M25/M40 family metallo-hydrolase [Gaiellaceae bacterium]
MAELRQDWLDELTEILRIPSISADAAHADDVRAAAEWVVARILGAGGTAEIVDWNGRPLAIGEVRASQGAEAAPTVLFYGHFDVQPPEPLELWESPPFEPEIRGEWIYARGIADDKGQLWMLLKATEELARAGELPVNVRFACDGEEEIGGHSIVDFLAEDERGADAAVIFDSGMMVRDQPEFNLGTRGLVYFHVELRSGQRDLHSGMYGGAALNALEALTQTLTGVLPRDGRVPEPLRKGIAAPTGEELEAWRSLQPGADALSEQGAVPLDATAADEFYVRTWAEPSITVHGIAGGSPHLQKTVLPVHAVANLSIRLAPGQRVDEIAPEVERLLREAAPAGAELDVQLLSASPAGLIPPDAQPIRLAVEAFERATGRRPLLVRSGGTLPIVPALADRGIPTVITGFALPESNVHSPNERMLVEYMTLGVETARELLRNFGRLGR